jgi:hypothetical protein
LSKGSVEHFNILSAAPRPRRGATLPGSGLCPQITQNNADAEKEFFICVHLRDLRTP